MQRGGKNNAIAGGDDADDGQLFLENLKVIFGESRVICAVELLHLSVAVLTLGSFPRCGLQ